MANERRKKETEFKEGMTKIMLDLLEQQFKEFVEFCVETNHAQGLNKLMELFQEYKWSEKKDEQ